ncbi:mitogen-activated protein kinase kinase kinase 20-like [Pyrus x bretschneideri]|uniref:mitogen-activated protein kinase kinase kinase 20-like n=1 Tax=Pyrus x bretschneideri TaxID=225117 RepID=UPI00202FD79F|nr:mitogen-activated protein kinase kinase kinase 20-like [Pyrus x bretschneideri]
MEWIRGKEIGRGSFATIYAAKPTSPSSHLPPLVAVKSSVSGYSDSLKNEKKVLDQIGSCPQIIRCFGDDHTVENGEKFFNLVLEYARGGTLADELKRNGGRLPEFDVRRHAKSVLRGLEFIHAKGFVHCDLKLQNVLVFGNGAAKIADFGLAKKAGESENKVEVRGTPLYMAPESVNDNEYESSSDIWAFGCLVAEMASGKPAWDHNPAMNMFKILMRIGGDELPQIPEELSEEGKDFVSKCFVKDTRQRWTAEMLLKHPFVSGDDHTVLLEEKAELSGSPRGPFDFPDWVSIASSEISPQFGDFSGKNLDSEFDWSSRKSFVPAADRLRQLAAEETPNWSFSVDWVTTM